MMFQIHSLEFECSSDQGDKFSHLTATLNRHWPSDNNCSSDDDGFHKCARLQKKKKKKPCTFSQLMLFVWHFEHSSAYRKLVLATAESALNRVPCDESHSLPFVPIKLIISFRIDHCDIFTPVDKSWNRKILKYSVLRMEIEEGLSWLSTLGGAFSSLGDRNVYFAKKAGQISLSQLRLSTVFGDPNLIARCFIYISHSLCQQGFRKKAIRLVKRILYPYLVHLNGNIERIVAQMYRSLRFRIYFVYK